MRRKAEKQTDDRTLGFNVLVNAFVLRLQTEAVFYIFIYLYNIYQSQSVLPTQPSNLHSEILVAHSSDFISATQLDSNQILTDQHE